MSRTLFGLFSLVLSAQGDPIGANCIKKLPARGKEEGTAFSDETILTTEIDQAMTFYAYTECNDQDGNLKSFSIIVADENGQNRARLNEVMPRGEADGLCPGYSLPSRDLFKGAIYADEERIYGLRLLTYDHSRRLQEEDLSLDDVLLDDGADADTVGETLSDANNGETLAAEGVDATDNADIGELVESTETSEEQIVEAETQVQEEGSMEDTGNVEDETAEASAEGTEDGAVDEEVPVATETEVEVETVIEKKKEIVRDDASKMRPADLGSLKGTPILTTFSSSEVLIGFYGTYTEELITSLGFLVHDPTCVPYVEPEPEPEPETDDKEKPEENDKPQELAAKPDIEEEGGSIAVLIIIIAVVLIAVAVVVFLFIRRRRRKRAQNTDGTDDKLGTVAPTNAQKLGDIPTGVGKGDRSRKLKGIVHQELNETIDDHLEVNANAGGNNKRREGEDSKRDLLTQADGQLGSDAEP